MTEQKRAASIQDISCLGRCSLTVVLPVLSAAGIETCILPTAVLSTHTGGFTGFTYRDLTSDIMPIANHWKSLDVKFDALYTGFLGDENQVEAVLQAVSLLRRSDTLFIADPAMADNGRLYSLFSADFPRHMLRICETADIITPNITEAALLLGEKCLDEPGEGDIKDFALRLLEKGPKNVIITSVRAGGGQIGAACMSKGDKKPRFFLAPDIEGLYHGAGDVFTSALLASILNGRDLYDSCAIAVDFTHKCIHRTKLAGTQTRFGLNFEAGLANLAGDISGYKKM